MAGTYAKTRGTQAETAVVNFLHDVTGVEVLRRSGYGAKDRGDVHIPGVPLVCEIKNTKRCYPAKWRDEVNAEVRNALARFGVLVWSPPGLGLKSVGRWLAIEWAEHALTPFARAGMMYAGPASKLADATRSYLFPGPLYLPMADEFDGIESCGRVRRLSDWAADLSEFIAARPLTR